jgi:hypothetical protein
MQDQLPAVILSGNAKQLSCVTYLGDLHPERHCPVAHGLVTVHDQPHADSKEDRERVGGAEGLMEGEVSRNHKGHEQPE